MNFVEKYVGNNGRKIIEVILVIYAACSMSYLYNLMAAPGGFSRSVFSVALFGLLWVGLRYVSGKWEQIEDKKLRKRRVCYVLGTGFALGASFVMGYQLQVQGMTALGIKGKLLIVLVSLGISVGLSPLVNMWFQILDGRKEKDAGAAEGLKKAWRSGKVFWVSWGVIFLCWIPIFLAYYPAIMSYDFNRQSIWAHLGYQWFTTHHPLIHTFLIKCFFHVGEFFGSYQVGMALFSLLQMLILSAVYAYSCNMIGRLTKKKWPVVVTAVVFALLPLHSVMVLCVTKDVLFSAFLLLFLLLMLERRMYGKREAVKKGLLFLLDAALVVTGILMLLFRNNAVYAFAVFAVFYVLWSSKERVRVLVLCLLIAASGQGVKAGMQAAMNAGVGSEAEMYSVFMQQMCRTALYHENTLTEEEWSVLNYYVPCDYWHDYNPTIADSIKANVTVTAFQSWKDDIPQMLKDWAEMGLRYPNDYIDAFLDLTRGYWFLDDVSHAEVLGYGEDSEYGLIYTFNGSQSEWFEGIENHSYLPGLKEMYQGIVSGNGYYDWPVLSNLFKPAFYCWVLILIMVSLVYRKQKSKLVLCMLPFWYLMTLLLGPVVNIRYVYPIIVAIPFLLAWLFDDKEGNVY